MYTCRYIHRKSKQLLEALPACGVTRTKRKLHTATRVTILLAFTPVLPLSLVSFLCSIIHGCWHLTYMYDACQDRVYLYFLNAIFHFVIPVLLNSALHSELNWTNRKPGEYFTHFDSQWSFLYFNALWVYCYFRKACALNKRSISQVPSFDPEFYTKQAFQSTN